MLTRVVNLVQPASQLKGVQNWQMLSGKDQHLACIEAKGTFDTRNAVTDSRRRGGRYAYAIYSTGKVR
jgi:hypothetical protein